MSDKVTPGRAEAAKVARNESKVYRVLARLTPRERCEARTASAARSVTPTRT